MTLTQTAVTVRPPVDETTAYSPAHHLSSSWARQSEEIPVIYFIYHLWRRPGSVPGVWAGLVPPSDLGGLGVTDYELLRGWVDVCLCGEHGDCGSWRWGGTQILPGLGRFGWPCPLGGYMLAGALGVCPDGPCASSMVLSVKSS